MPENNKGHQRRARKGRWIANDGRGKVIINVQRREGGSVIVLNSMRSSKHKCVRTIGVIKI